MKWPWNRDPDPQETKKTDALLREATRLSDQLVEASTDLHSVVRELHEERARNGGKTNGEPRPA